MGYSRREFIARVGQAGGFGAAFVAMQGLGLMPERAAAAEPMNVAPGTGKGVKVAILGGGIAGLVSAYELRALGFECTVLEARARPGGRNWTVRPGDKIVFTDGTTQECHWDDGHYQNFGPARLPSIHTTMLGYCRKLGVELQVEINTSRSSLLQNDGANGGRPMVQRQVINDTRGHVSELLAKCVNAGALDQELTATDRDRMLSFLRVYGPLDSGSKYVGSERAGYKVTPGAGDQAGVLSDPIDMHTLLDEDFWQGILFEEMFDMQATMFQPVGGMDRIPYAFAKSLGKMVQYESPVMAIWKTAKGVRIEYTHKGKDRSLEADYCVCAMPLTILKRTANDFSEPYKRVIEESTYAHAYKIAWESRRFWEQDYNIYGGLEFVNEGCSPVWFPSAGLFTPRGVLVSGYEDESFGGFEGLAIADKFTESRRTIERLHPGHGKELEKPLYVGWGRIPWNEGSWIRSYGAGESSWPGAGRRGRMAPDQTQSFSGYETLTQPDGPIYFAGCHVSHIVAWQEGAARSAQRVVRLIGERVKGTAS